ncbi:MAG: hypothetical protein EZS28_036163 [Streblomastix strix]|uniref:Uncharacterized protein n=1 Tax=Streblomastix strix TaxID=222440 RepID=A0A5J4UDM6_9EUKA|nr:MAG: hypothetical protein EZS28_036163 [Streblomastix strix]
MQEETIYILCKFPLFYLQKIPPQVKRALQPLMRDSGTGTAGTANVYASATHQHPLNVDLSAANVPLVNATAAANGTSDFYSRNDHVHPQQLTYDGNITATKSIKTGGTDNDLLLADGTTKKLLQQQILEPDLDRYNLFNIGVTAQGQIAINICLSHRQHPVSAFQGNITEIPLADNGIGVAGTSNEYARGNDKHPLNIKLQQTTPKKDTGTGVNDNFNYYSRFYHAHPLNVDPTLANVPLVKATAATNGTCDYYCRNDHVPPQQLTYDGNITATKFIKTGGLATEILCANGDTKDINGVNGFGKISADIYYNEVRVLKIQLCCTMTMESIEQLIYCVDYKKYCRNGQIAQTMEPFNHPE